MAKLSKEDVLRLARLARIELSEEEIAEFQTELSDILAYVEQLQQADTKDVAPTDQVTGLVNVARPDEIKGYGYKPSELLSNVPKTKDDQIMVKRMVE